MDDEERDPWISWVAIALYGCGAVYALIGIVFGVGLVGLGGLTGAQGGSDEVVMGVTFAIEGVVIGAFTLAWAALNFAGGWGFSNGTRWGWFVALLLGGIYTPSMCLPIGAAILYGCLNDRTRKTFIG